MRLRPTVRRAAAAVVLLPLGLTACSDRDAPAEQAATAFYQAVAAKDGAAACRLLAPATLTELEKSAGMPCEQAILEEDVPEVHEPLDIQVYGTAGMVRFATETTFLGDFDGHWRVVAAACAPEAGDRPHDCELTGG